MPICLDDIKKDKHDIVCTTLTPYEPGSPDRFWMRTVRNYSGSFFNKLGITDGLFFCDVVEEDIPVENLFEAFCSACEATALHQHRSALEEWLNDQLEEKNAEWYGVLQEHAFGAFRKYCKALRNPEVMTLIDSTRVPEKSHESDEELEEAIRRSLKPKQNAV